MARRAGLRGRRWALVALVVTIAVAVPVSMSWTPHLWRPYASGLDTVWPTN